MGDQGVARERGRSPPGGSHCVTYSFLLRRRRGIGRRSTSARRNNGTKLLALCRVQKSGGLSRRIGEFSPRVRFLIDWRFNGIRRINASELMIRVVHGDPSPGQKVEHEMILDRRTLLRNAALAPLVAATGRAPNVLFIISDQLHHAVPAKTPNIDRLAAEGVRFKHAVCATPFCSPTRASFMTGLYPHAHGITYNVGDPDRGLDSRLLSTEQVLVDGGYTCRQFGKWHLGDRSRIPAYKNQPESGYRDNEDQPRRNRNDGTGRNGVPVLMTDALKRANAEYDHGGANNTLIGRIDLPPEKMVESRITSEAIQELDRLAGKPFFLTVSLPAPHAPWEICEPYYGMHPRSGIALPSNRNAVEPADRSTAARRFGQLLGDEGMREWLGVYRGLVSMVGLERGPPAGSTAPAQTRPRHPGHIHCRSRRHAGRPRLLRQDHVLHV